MGSQAQDTEELLERIQRLEEAEAARQRVTSTAIIRAPAKGSDTTTRTDLSARPVQMTGEDTYVLQLEERVRYLEGLHRAYRARRIYFLLSAMCFAAAVGAAAVVAFKVRHFVGSKDLLASPRNLPTALKHYFNAIVVAFALDVMSIAFLIFGLFSRPPRPR
jgi:hypothetical protein